MDEGQNTRIDRVIKANVANRGIYKWFLEFTRNCMVVAALFYLARKSDSWWMYTIAGIAGFALVAYCYTYVENWWYRWPIVGRGWRRSLIILASALVLQLMLGIITISLMTTINKITEIQGMGTKGP
jgi:hypothetical protein